MPRISRPCHMPLQTTPRSGIAAASEPASRVGQREARDLEALRQPRQVVVLLLLGAVVQQQFRRPERVRHHHRDRGARCSASRAWSPPASARSAEKPMPPYFFGMIMPRKPLSLMYCQACGGRSSELVRDLPVVDHRGRAPRSRCRGRPAPRRVSVGCGNGEQLRPVRPAGEQVAVPPHGAGVDRVGLGVRHRRQDLAVDREHRVAEQAAPQRREREDRGDCRERASSQSRARS